VRPRTAKACVEPGCAALVYGGRYCAQHARASQRAQDAKRLQDQPWRRWHWTARWRAIVAAQLRAQPCCATYAREGVITVATVCDHVVSHRGDPHLFWHGESQSLCKTCHDSVKQTEEVAERKRLLG